MSGWIIYGMTRGLSKNSEIKYMRCNGREKTEKLGSKVTTKKFKHEDLGV